MKTMNERFERIREEIRDDTFLLLRHTEIEAALESRGVVKAFNNTFAAHGFNAVRHVLTLSAVQALARLTDPATARNSDRASYPAVVDAFASGLAAAASDERRESFLKAAAELIALRPDIKKFRDVHLAHNLIVEEAPQLNYDQVDRASDVARLCFVAMESAFGAVWDFEQFAQVERNYARAFSAPLRMGMQLVDARDRMKKELARRQFDRNHASRDGIA